MPSVAIGRLTPIDLRDVWPSEPADFTPWLATSENLQFLAESLELPGLELVQTEHPVDSFSADIVAKIVDTDHHVLIENQLERTDHRHLGQVLTYAPRFDARIVVWIAKEFTDAHRAALDWLNRITADGYAFFGVEVRAVRIGDSAPAPLFNIVAKPNDWTRVAQSGAEAAGAEPSEYAASNLAFWPAFHDVMVAKGGPLRQTAKPLKDSHYWAPVAGNGRAYIAAYRLQSSKPRIGVMLAMYNRGAVAAGNKLLQRKVELDALYGGPLEWSINPQETVFKIVVPPRAVSNDDSWSDQYAWLADHMQRMGRVFGEPVLEALAETDAEAAGSAGEPTDASEATQDGYEPTSTPGAPA